MTRKLFLHIGPPKTGTSVVQNFLRKHENSAVVYPKTGIASGSGHADLVWAFFGKSADGDRPTDEHARFDDLLAQVAAETRRSSKNILISSETLAKPYGDCKDIGAFVRALMLPMDDQPLDVEVLVACREHFSWAASIYNQRVKSKNSGTPELRDPDEFLRSTAPTLQYANVVRKIRRMGLKLTVLNYHPSNEWFVRFLTHIGFVDFQVPVPPIRNASLSVPMLIAKLAANRVLEGEAERRQFAAKLKQMRGMTNTVSIFSTDACADAEQWFGADRQFLRDECAIEFPASEIRFSGFSLDQDGIDEIARVAGGLGQVGQKIVEIASQYVI